MSKQKELNIEPPTIDPNWPWVLEEIAQSKADGKVLKHSAIGLSTSQVSKIRLQYAKGKDLFEFRRGKPLQIELEDATVTFKLTRQGASPGNLKGGIKILTKKDLNIATVQAIGALTADNNQQEERANGNNDK